MFDLGCFRPQVYSVTARTVHSRARSKRVFGIPSNVGTTQSHEYRAYL
jgi:hypothetical protein